MKLTSKRASLFPEPVLEQGNSELVIIASLLFVNVKSYSRNRLFIPQMRLIYSPEGVCIPQMWLIKLILRPRHLQNGRVVIVLALRKLQLIIYNFKASFKTFHSE